MARATVKQTLEAPADAVWRLIAAFGDTSWMPAGTRATVKGSGPGMTRAIAAGPDRTIVERLESVDASARTLVYTIPENVPFPVTDYRATLRVLAAPAGCELEWSASFTPAGAPEADCARAIEGMYGLMIGWIGARAKALAG